MSKAKFVCLCAVLSLLAGCSDAAPSSMQPLDRTSAEFARSADPSDKTARGPSAVALAAAPSDGGEIEQTVSKSEATAFHLPTRGNANGIPLRVLYLARSDQERARAFVNLFEEHFQAAASVSREQFIPAQADEFDVVVFDWSQDERPGKGYASPLGDLENWSTPTVLLGSAGLINAGPWRVLGGAG